MNPFIQQIVNQKIKRLTPSELIQYANSYDISVTENEAKKIIAILRAEKSIDLKDQKQHRKIIQTVNQKVSPELARKADKLLQQFSHLFT